MAVVTAHISWPAVPGSLGYLLEYRAQPSLVWVTPGPPTNPPNPTLSLTYDLEINEGTTYDLRISSACANGASKYIYTTLFDPLSPTLEWVEDTYTCEQDSPFTLDTTYTGFSSPQGIFWDDTSQLFYVVDVDDALGNVFTFDPDTITGFVSANHIVGANAPIGLFVAAHAFDPVNRRIWTAGDDTNGARVLDIASGTWTLLSYGTNGSLGSARRSPVVLSASTAYCFSASPDTIETFDLVTLAPISSISKGTIPSSGTYMTQSYGVTFVGSEAWVHAGQRGDGNIAVYDSAFTSLLTTIVLPSISTPGGSWTPNPGLYWQSHYYDAVGSRWYVSDTGSSRIIIIDTATKTVVNNIVIGNKRGKDFAACSFFKNELTGEIFASVQCIDTATDTANTKLYRIVGDEITYIFPDQSTTALKNRIGTNEGWGVQQNLVKPTGAWATDGLVFKYTL